MCTQAPRLAASIAFCCLVALGGAAPPVAAPQGNAPVPHTEAGLPASDPQDPMAAAVGVNMRRSKLYQDHDIPGAAALYTDDAAYVELMPSPQILKGRDQIKGHFEELASAYAVSIVPTVLQAERGADGTILVSGDYVVFLKDNAEIAGHFVQTLRQEGGTWRIAMHVFARPDPLTATDFEKYRRD